MKKFSIHSSYFLILIFLCVSASPRFVSAGMVIGSGGVSSCDSCTGALVFSSHFENNDDITQGTPPNCGCSTNSTKTWSRTNALYSSQTYTGWPTDGSYSMLISGATNTATIPIDASKTAGTLQYDFYITTWAASSRIGGWRTDSSNKIDILTSATGQDCIFEYQGGGVLAQVSTSGSACAANVKHSLIARWSATPVGGNTLSLQIDGGTIYTTSTAIPTYSGSLPDFGFPSSTTTTSGVFYVDNLKVYNAWQ